MNSKLSVSNIAWSSLQDMKMYGYLADHGYAGIEIAPTRILPNNPYHELKEASSFSECLYTEYGLKVSSMQSIWYGKTENIFGSIFERDILIEYTKNAVDFAEAMKCKNLVFGCPKNRTRNNRDVKYAYEFFEKVGVYAADHGVVIALEANPKIYNTDFINFTSEAFSFVKNLNCAGVKVNLDIGTMIENKESVKDLFDDFCYVNHIHISEPFLNPLQKRNLHVELKDLINEKNYEGFVSLEMGNHPESLFDSLGYFEETFA